MGEGDGVCVLENLNSSTLGHPHVLWFIGRYGDVALYTGKVVAIFVITTLLIVFADNSSKNLYFATENHCKAFTTHGLFDAGKSSTIAPFIEFTTECVGLEFEEPKLAGSQEVVTTGCMDVGDGQVDDRRLGWMTNL